MSRPIRYTQRTSGGGLQKMMWTKDGFQPYSRVQDMYSHSKTKDKVDALVEDVKDIAKEAEKEKESIFSEISKLVGSMSLKKGGGLKKM